MTDAVHGETLVGVPEEELLQELPLEQSDLLPLNALVERVSNNAYQTLQSLSDTLPSLSNDAKKAKVFATAMDLRKQFIKLLVLVRWSKDVELLNKTRNIIALLVDQQWAHEDVFSGLTQVRKILPNARICDADLVTAIDVIRTGTYQRLPASIRDSTVPRVPMSNPQVLDVLRALDQVLTVRLTCSEVVPRDLRLQRIADGKAYFEAPGLYDACLTTSGPNDDDRWWLLDFHFTDSATDGDEDLSALLTAPYLDNVFASAEAILAPKDELEEEPAFIRLHSFLEQQALQRQLHILNYQLQRVARLHWGGNVRFGLDLTSHTMTVQYWVVHSASPSAQERTKSLHKGILQGRLKLRLYTEPLTGSKKVLSELLSGSKADQGKSAIVVDWDVDEAIRKATSDLPELALDQLDIEALILAAIDRHSLALMKLFQQDIVAHPGLGRIGIKSLDPNQGTGDELKLSLSETQNSALQRMADQITANTAVLVETLLNFRLQSLAKELELQASWLGLAHLSTIALRPGELDKIGLPNGYPLLYLPLGILPTYYMFIYFIPGQPIAMALVSVMAVVEAGKSMQVISSVKWIDRAQLTSITISGQTLLNAPSKTWLDTSTPRYDLTSEELQLAYNYCIATVAFG
ncbi:mediator complex subunit [Malassezia japonica]|uniref:Mediator of RNA polymerase II transcription subunit 14 n=1 Tax=Malassezia japonica TaxID=223818 RepID=A0AAF0JAV4_9BASI|nr:mediator complex subunit [Malassezia japonica]WFD39585.1 mediator complex subunit [Malassezia japonica]